MIYGIKLNNYKKGLIINLLCLEYYFIVIFNKIFKFIKINKKNKFPEPYFFYYKYYLKIL